MASERPPGFLARLRRRLFGTRLDAALSTLVLVALVVLLPPTIDWLLIDAAWHGEGADDCRAGGACWPFVAERFDSAIFGFYPAEARWRLVLILVLATLAVVVVSLPRLRYRGTIAVALAVGFPVVAGLLFHGGALGFEVVDSSQLGGLFLTLTVSGFAILTGLPAGLALALMRESKLPLLRWTAAAWIEVWRGLPTVVVLFMAIAVFPLLTDQGTEISKLVRALIAFTLMTSAMFAEAIRAGLQSVPKQQVESAIALGFGYWRRMRLVVLPQALAVAIPNIVNVCVALVKESTLILIIGLYDVFGVLQSATLDPRWASESVTLSGYLVAGAIFWAICFTLSRYSRMLEARVDRTR